MNILAAVAAVEACCNVTQHQWGLHRINTEFHSKCLAWLISRGGGGLDLQCMTENMTALSNFMYSHLIPADRRGLKISHPHEYFTAACSLLWWLALYFSFLFILSLPVFRLWWYEKMENLTYDMTYFLKWLKPCSSPPFSASAFVWKDIDAVYLLKADSSILSQRSNTIHHV